MNQESSQNSASAGAGRLPDGVARLNHLGVIRLEGEESAKFIHGQLTQDFSLLKNGQARLAAFCSAKGRVLVSFVGLNVSDSEILLICSKDLLPPMLKRLSMFVLRAKTKLSDASDRYDLYGLAGAAALPNSAEAVAATPWSAWQNQGAHVIQLYPADGVPRQMSVAPAGQTAPAGANLSPDLWRWGEVRSGVGQVQAVVSDQFVPQMLNYESLGGVNFKKGCYPGQEVVARSQFRGTLKRRTYLVHVDQVAQNVEAGQEIYAAHDAEQPVGAVVQAAENPAGGWDALVSLQTAAIEGSKLHVGSSSGPALEVLPLPYALLDDI